MAPCTEPRRIAILHMAHRAVDPGIPR